MPNLTAPQKYVLGIGVAVVALLLLFPPWTVHYDNGFTRPMGHASALFPPEGTITVAGLRLLIEVTSISLLTLIAMVLLKPRQSQAINQ